MLLALALCLAPLQEARYVGPAFFPDPAVGGKWIELELPATEDTARFALYVPSQRVANPALLVHFHSFGLNHAEVGLLTDFMFEADQRGWYLICPDQDIEGLNFKTYGNPTAQRRVQAVLEWALAKLPIDSDRVYAYGFSMGGGDVLSYAAQHLDPDGVMFAAVAQNAGTLHLPREHENSIPAQVPLEDAFGTSPLVHRFPFVKASSLEYDAGNLLRLDRSAALNLASTPMQSWIDPTDRTLLVEFGDDLDGLLAPSMNHESHLVSNPMGSHRWDTFDFKAVCDWFDPQRLTIPEDGELVVARDARFYDVWVQREELGGVGRVTFDLNANGGVLPHRLEFTGCENIQELGVDAGLSGIPATFDVHFEADTIRPMLLRVDQFPAAPGAVILDTVDVTSLRGTRWDWVNGVLTLLTPASGTVPVPHLAQWQVQ